jgi:hypothetical protein
MRILFDQGTPVPLRDHLAGHFVQTVFELGWSNLANGALLASAEIFDLLITTDQQLRHQQNLGGRSLGHPCSHDNKLAAHDAKRPANSPGNLTNESW